MQYSPAMFLLDEVGIFQFNEAPKCHRIFMFVCLQKHQAIKFVTSQNCISNQTLMSHVIYRHPTYPVTVWHLIPEDNHLNASCTSSCFGVVFMKIWCLDFDIRQHKSPVAWAVALSIFVAVTLWSCSAVLDGVCIAFYSANLNCNSCWM